MKLVTAVLESLPAMGQYQKEVLKSKALKLADVRLCQLVIKTLIREF